MARPNSSQPMRKRSLGDLVHQKQLKEAGRLARLIARYRGAAEWASLSEANPRRQRDNIFTRIIVENGSKAAAKLRREHIVAGRDRRISTPAAANNFLKTRAGYADGPQTTA